MSTSPKHGVLLINKDYVQLNKKKGIRYKNVFY
jgi:hypothetical protein